MAATSDVDDVELQEALQRSLEQTNLEEAMFAKALAESISTRDEEIARAMQREQLLMLEKRLCDDSNDAAGPSTQPPPPNPDASVPAQTLQAPPAEDTSHDEELARLLQRAEDQRREERDVQLRMQHEDALASLRRQKSEEEERERDGQLPTRLSRGRKESRTNAGASASTGPSSQAWHLQSPSQRFYVHSHLSSDAEKRRRLDDISGNGAGPSSEQTRENEVSASPPASAPPLVVIDGQNVGFSYQGGGAHRTFCARGVEVALNYYNRSGIRAVAMVPAWRGDKKDEGADLLNKLADEGQVSFTPPGSHDDYFLLAYAKQRNIDIVSNDRFSKEIRQQETPEAANALRSFLNRHLIPYTFVNREFLPNPNPRQLSRAEHCRRQPRYTRG